MEEEKGESVDLEPVLWQAAWQPGKGRRPGPGGAPQDGTMSPWTNSDTF